MKKKGEWMGRKRENQKITKFTTDIRVGGVLFLFCSFLFSREYCSHASSITRWCEQAAPNRIVCMAKRHTKSWECIEHNTTQSTLCIPTPSVILFEHSDFFYGSTKCDFGYKRFGSLSIGRSIHLKNKNHSPKEEYTTKNELVHYWKRRSY